MITKKKIPANSPNVTSTTPPSSSISDAEVQECLGHLDSIATVLAPYLASLTATQRKKQAKGRKEVEAVVPQLATLATRFELVNASVNVDQMTQDAALSSALQPIIGRTRTLLGSLGDTVVHARSNVCSTATTVHTFLKRLAKKNSSLQGELSVVSGAFARKTTKAKAAAVTESTPPAEATTTGATAPAAAATAAKAG